MSQGAWNAFRNALAVDAPPGGGSPYLEDLTLGHADPDDPDGPDIEDEAIGHAEIISTDTNGMVCETDGGTRSIAFGQIIRFTGPSFA